MDVYNYAQAQGIPYRGVLLDSWWYFKVCACGSVGGARGAGGGGASRWGAAGGCASLPDTHLLLLPLLRRARAAA